MTGDVKVNKGHFLPGRTCQKSKRSPAVRVCTVRTQDGGTKTVKCGRKLAILFMCMECMGWDHPEMCTDSLCPLYQFRGKTKRSYRGDETGVAK